MIQHINDKNSSLTASIYLPDGTTGEKTALKELKNVLLLQDTIERLEKEDGYIDKNCKVHKIIETPDFHKGTGIPIGTVLMTEGFVVPQAMGNDINCGMRTYTLNITEEEVTKNLDSIIKQLRYLFFEGGRQIPMTGRQRKAMFQNGLTGLLETYEDTKDCGIWSYFSRETEEENIRHTAFGGSLLAKRTEGLMDFIGNEQTMGYDEQIGTIGGGNHFVEIQRVADIYDRQTANAWGIKKGNLMLMIHSGSLMLGKHSGMLNRTICKSIYPTSIKQPVNDLYLLPDSEKFKEEWERVWSSTCNAANFAFANRLFLGLMAKQALTEVLHDFDMKLIYDSPHNFIWQKEIDGKNCFIHRKGACSSEGFEAMADTPFAYYGEPVMIPGSMGSSSYLLRGTGNPDSLWSASHGAGRKMSRGDAIHENDQLFEEFMEKFHIVTPIDPDRNDLKGRWDILKKWKEGIKSEAPYAYKDIDQVIKTHEEHDMAGLVARMEPILTIKA